jgi:hypothetical protein
MRKFLINILKPFIKQLVIDEINKEESKQIVVKLIDDKLDIPNMTDAEEKAFFAAEYDLVKEYAVKMIDRI